MLAAIVLVSLNSARSSAKLAKTKAQMINVIKAIELARDDRNQVLGVIVGNFWSIGAFNCLNRDLRNPVNDPCNNQYISYYQSLGFATAPMDGWNSPLLMDENELEAGFCTKDDLYSAGPNGVFEGGGGDDLHKVIPFFACSSAQGSNSPDSF